MAAIKQISIQRGRDMTMYTLNCFGGAAGQHACLVADSLGVGGPHPPLAGVLSAYGIGQAEMRIARGTVNLALEQSETTLGKSPLG